VKGLSIQDIKKRKNWFSFGFANRFPIFPSFDYISGLASYMFIVSD
jgi:hypothetical protein